MKEFTVCYKKVEFGKLVDKEQHFKEWHNALDMAYRVAEKSNHPVWIEDYDSREVLLTIQ